MKNTWAAVSTHSEKGGWLEINYSRLIFLMYLTTIEMGCCVSYLDWVKQYRSETKLYNLFTKKDLSPLLSLNIIRINISVDDSINFWLNAGFFWCITCLDTSSCSQTMFTRGGGRWSKNVHFLSTFIRYQMSTEGGRWSKKAKILST